MSKIDEKSLWIKDCRLGSPHILTPQESEAGLRYNAVLIMEPDAVEWQEAMAMVGALVTEKWGDQAQAVLNVMGATKNLRCYGAGNEKIDPKTGLIYGGFEGKVFISANNKVPPNLYGQDAQPLPPTANANEMFVGGNYCAAIISFWPQDNKHGRAVRAQLDGVQYIREGEHFGATGPDTDAIFQPVPGAPAATAAAPGMPAPVMPGMPAAAPVAPAAAPAPVADINSFL